MFLLNLHKIDRYLLPAVFFAALDRFLKSLAARQADFGLVGDFFKFSFAENRYIAFSLPLYGNFLNILILAILLGLLYYFLTLIRKDQPREAGLILILIFGAASNLFDRLKYGFVVDYLDLRYFTVFNIADIMIVGSVGLLIYYSFKKDV